MLKTLWIQCVMMCEVPVTTGSVCTGSHHNTRRGVSVVFCTLLNLKNNFAQECMRFCFANTNFSKDVLRVNVKPAQY